MGFCKEFNAKTAAAGDMIIPVVITVFSDRSFTFIMKTPPASVLIKKALGLKIGKKPGSGLASAEQGQGRQDLRRRSSGSSPQMKIQDMNAAALEACMRSHRGHRPLAWASTSSTETSQTLTVGSRRETARVRALAESTRELGSALA